MSRIGNKPIAIPAGVEVIINGSTVTTKGPKGELTKTFKPVIGIEVKDGDIILAKIPIDKETGMYLLDFDLLENEYYAIKQTFKNNKVLMTPLDIEVVSKEKEIINA